MFGVAASQEPEPHYRLHAHLERAAALARVDPDHAEEEVHEAVAAALADARTATCRRCLTEATVRGAEALARVARPPRPSSFCRAPTSRLSISTTPSGAISPRWPCSPS